MFADLDYSHPEVEADVINWGQWLSMEVTLKGIRFDAVKHFSEEFLNKFVDELTKKHGEGWFFVGEYWKDDLDDMARYIERMGNKFSLFDAPLVHNFSKLSKTENADLRTVFDDTWVKMEPVNAVVSSPSLARPVYADLKTKDAGDEPRYAAISGS
jgi:alpha-amylase